MSAGPGAASDPGADRGPGAADLPRTWRLRRAAVVPLGVAAVLVASTAVIWVTLPGETRVAFSWPQRVTVLITFGLAVAVLVGFAACRVTADTDGLVLVNVFRVRRVGWHLVLGLRYRPDDPWPVLRLADDVQVGVLGIQSSDGVRARVNAAELADVIIARTGR